LAHTAVGPEIAPACAGAPVTVTDDALLLAHELFAFTEIVPLEKLLVKATFTVVVPWPLLTDAPAGTVHV
jgi:hypothetical protein